MPTQLKVANRSKFVAEALLGGCGNAAGGTTCPPQGGQGHSPGTPLVPFVVKRKEPRVWAGQAHWWVLGLPAGAASPAKAPGVGGAERPPRNKHTPGTARQAVWPRTKPIRESGAASCRRLNKTDENFDLHKRAQPKASDLRESVQSRPAGGPFAKWAQAQPAANRVRHHAAANRVWAQPAAAREKLK